MLGRHRDGRLTFLGVSHAFLSHEVGLRDEPKKRLRERLERKGWGNGLLAVLNIGLKEGSEEAGGGSFGFVINHFLTFFHHFNKNEKTCILYWASSARVFLVLQKLALLLIHFCDPKSPAACLRLLILRYSTLKQTVC